MNRLITKFYVTLAPVWVMLFGGIFVSCESKEEESELDTAPLYEVDIHTGTVKMKELSAICYVDGFLRIDTDADAYDLEYGICYATSQVPTMADNVMCKRLDNKRSNRIQIEFPEAFACLNLVSETTYYYRAYFKDNLTGKISYASEINTFTTPEFDSNANSPSWINLGLSVKWATCNVGADSPEQDGDYFAWGETERKERYDSYTYKYYYNNTGKYVDIGSNLNDTQYDVASLKLGESWRIPTINEMTELCTACNWVWMTYNGINGHLITGPNENSIFLPATGYYNGTKLRLMGVNGYYWSSMLFEFGNSNACCLYFSRDGWYNNENSREYGLTIRPVCE